MEKEKEYGKRAIPSDARKLNAFAALASNRINFQTCFVFVYTLLAK